MSRVFSKGQPRSRLSSLLLAAALALPGCGAAEPASPNGAAANAAAGAGDAACPAGDRLLPITGLCAARAVNYLNIPGVVGDGGPAEPPQDCSWDVQETRFGADVLLYRAATCGKNSTRLAFAGESGALSYDSSAQGWAKGTLVAKVVDVAGDGTAEILKVSAAAIEDPAEKAKCRVRKAGLEGWPKDALVVDTMTLEEDRAAPQDGPRAACGSYGFNGDETAYWRVFQGHGWFFQLGQDAPEIDPGSFTLLTRRSDGSWAPVE